MCVFFWLFICLFFLNVFLVLICLHHRSDPVSHCNVSAHRWSESPRQGGAGSQREVVGVMARHDGVGADGRMSQAESNGGGEQPKDD